MQKFKNTNIYFSEKFNNFINDIGEIVDKKLRNTISFFNLKNFNPIYDIHLFDNEYDYRDYLLKELKINSYDPNKNSYNKDNSFVLYFNIIERDNDLYLESLDGRTSLLSHSFSDYISGEILKCIIRKIYYEVLFNDKRYKRHDWVLIGLLDYLSGSSKIIYDNVAFIELIEDFIRDYSFDGEKYYSLVSDKSNLPKLEEFSLDVYDIEEYVCYIVIKYALEKLSRRKVLKLLLDDEYYKEVGSNNKLLNDMIDNYYHKDLPYTFLQIPSVKYNFYSKESYDTEVFNYNSKLIEEDDDFIISEGDEDEYSYLEDIDDIDDYIIDLEDEDFDNIGTIE